MVLPRRARSRYVNRRKLKPAEGKTDHSDDDHYIQRHDLTLDPSDEHRCTLVLLHGLQCSPEDWLQLVPYLHDCGVHGVRLKVPCAPLRSNPKYWGGDRTPGPSWFDYHTDCSGKEEEDEVDEGHVAEQRARILGMIEREVKLLGGDARKVVLGGCSQGCSMACEIAMAWNEANTSKLGGLVLQRGLGMSQTWSRAQLLGSDTTKVLICHGEDDDVYPVDFALGSFEPLKSAGFDVQVVRLKDIDHGSDSLDEQRATAKFIARCLL
mmetsp:Transcript_62124/g.143052  ORF Transcript_62124/g.143052 Transcript_62124/m.143052 type:complete len:266 (+) Transcript_62124:31-828(+)